MSHTAAQMRDLIRRTLAQAPAQTTQPQQDRAKSA